MTLSSVIIDSREPGWVQSLTFGGVPTATVALDAGDVWAAIDALPPTLRDVVTLAYGAGQTHAEIGQRLGRPAGTVSYQLSKARGLLATSLAGF